VINRIATIEAPGNGRRKASPFGPQIGPAGQQLNDIERQLKHFIGDHPALSLALGLTIGIMVGCLIKRR
jgi:ElaB/YqjD/DUF883 family membrane-anchored ribosome-binding protein